MPLRIRVSPLIAKEMIQFRNERTGCRDGMCPTDPLAAEAEEDAALLVLEFGHGGGPGRAKE